MASSGLLPDRGGEVLDGLVLEMSPKGDRQGYAVSEPAAQFGDQRRDRYRVYADSLSLRLGPHDEPEPDIALARATRTFATERPLALAFDLGEKKAKYGGSAIPEYWVVDLQTETVHMFSNPRGNAYLDERVAKAGELISPSAFDDVAIAIALVFGKS